MLAGVQTSNLRVLSAPGLILAISFPAALAGPVSSFQSTSPRTQCPHCRSQRKTAAQPHRGITLRVACIVGSSRTGGETRPVFNWGYCMVRHRTARGLKLSEVPVSDSSHALELLGSSNSVCWLFVAQQNRREGEAHHDDRQHNDNRSAPTGQR